MNGNERFEKPEFEKDAFHCPHCNTYAKMNWKGVQPLTKVFHKSSGTWSYSSVREPDPEEELMLSYCERCSEYAIWRDEEMIYPTGNAPPPNKGLPDEIKEIYKEARKISDLSPKSSAALLRLALEMLLNHLSVGDKNSSLYERIGELDEQELNPQIQKMMDTVRITGNEAVHPGEIDFEDSPKIVNQLFFLINEVAYEMITKPQQINEMFEDLPENKKKGVEDRDKR